MADRSFNEILRKYFLYILLVFLLMIPILWIDFCPKNRVFIPHDKISITYRFPKNIDKLENGNFLLDFGKSGFGNLDIVQKSANNDSIILHLGETLTKEKFVSRKPYGSIRYQRVSIADGRSNKRRKIKLKETELNTSRFAIKLPDSLKGVMPFRYCEIENLNIPIEKVIIRQKIIIYNFSDDVSNFTSSDTILNKIWDLCSYTIKATSFLGLYVDGDRERIPYEADAYINMLGHFTIDNDYSIAKRTNEYFLENPTWPTEWVLHTVPLFYQYYMYSGDINPIRKNYQKLKAKTLFELEREDGLISSKSTKLTISQLKKIGFKENKIRLTHFYDDLKSKIYDLFYGVEPKMVDIIDWPHPNNDDKVNIKGETDNFVISDYNSVVNSFYYKNLKLMSIIAGFLNKN